MFPSPCSCPCCLAFSGYFSVSTPASGRRRKIRTPEKTRTERDRVSIPLWLGESGRYRQPRRHQRKHSHVWFRLTRQTPTTRPCPGPRNIQEVEAICLPGFLYNVFPLSVSRKFCINRDQSISALMASS